MRHAVFGLAVLLTGHAALALDFIPTEAEWLAWPPYCRARYVELNVAREGGIDFGTRVPPAEVEAQRKLLGDEAWYWIHHYCAGTAELSRARTAETAYKGSFWLTEGTNEITGMYKRISPSNPFFGQVVVGLAGAYRQGGKTDAALQLLQQGISAQPSFPSSYALTALIHRDNGETQKALDTLRQGNDATDGQSAEIHYFLGLLLIDMNDLNGAVVHAKKAYELGYPLPGLKVKLRHHNRTID